MSNNPLSGACGKNTPLPCCPSKFQCYLSWRETTYLSCPILLVEPSGEALGNANRTLDSVVNWVLLQCFQTKDDIISNILMIFLETKPFVTSLFHALVNKTYMPAPKLETVSIIIIIVSNSIN